VRVLGVDPGLARIGVAVVEGEPGRLRLLYAGCIETAAGRPEEVRLCELFDALTAVATAHRPETAAVEQLFFASNRRSAMRVAQARGVALCALARSGLPVAEYTPMQVKEAVAGWGAAGKPQVARMSFRLLGLDSIPGPDDVSDACAVAICHHHRARLVVATGRTSAPAPLSPGLADAVARAREVRS
jgi:crossover junction endodeoxyribonuclease RuvC